eukprot:jgi/Chlat1/3004/Chrsp2S04717
MRCVAEFVLDCLAHAGCRLAKSSNGCNGPLRAHRRPATVSHVEAAAAEKAIDVSTCPAIKPNIDDAAVAALDLRVGVVVDAKQVHDKEISEKRGKPTMSRTLLELKVNLGAEQRTIVSECRFVWDVEDAVGKKVLVIANSEPKEIQGIRSHGIILSGVNYDPTPMPRSFKVIMPGLGRLPPGSQVMPAAVPK